MCATDLGILMVSNILHPRKTSSPILVTESGMLIEVKPSHLEKAPFPIDVIESGN